MTDKSEQSAAAVILGSPRMVDPFDDTHECIIHGHTFDASTYSGDALCVVCGHTEPDQSEEYEYETDADLDIIKGDILRDRAKDDRADRNREALDQLADADDERERATEERESARAEKLFGRLP